MNTTARRVQGHPVKISRKLYKKKALVPRMLVLGIYPFLQVHVEGKNEATVAVIGKVTATYVHVLPPESRIQGVCTPV